MGKRTKRTRPAGPLAEVWTAEEAQRVKERMQAWFTTHDGVSAAHIANTQYYLDSWPVEPGQTWALSRGFAEATAQVLEKADLIWCDPPMVDLTAAAADTYPAEPFLIQSLPSPHGIVIFAKPLPTVWQGEHGRAIDQLAALIWVAGYNQFDEVMLRVTAWRRHIGRAKYAAIKVPVYWPGLRLLSHAAGVDGAVRNDTGEPAGPNEILQTLAALLRTSLVRDEVSVRTPGTGASAPADPGRIRRIYLRKPEHAAEELAEAVAARGGRAALGHWVRGHWKNQWHPSIQQHRAIWIAGYPRGDFALGELTGPKILIAADDPAQDQVK